MPGQLGSRSGFGVTYEEGNRHDYPAGTGIPAEACRLAPTLRLNESKQSCCTETVVPCTRAFCRAACDRVVSKN